MTYLLFTHSHRHTTRREEGRLPCPFLKIDKCLDFGGKGSDCVHIWVKFSIRNVVLIVSRRKKLQNVSLRGLCLFLCFWRNVCGHETFKNPIQTIQTYSCPIQTYSAIFKKVALAYLERCHIQNPGIFRTRDIFRNLSRHILVYLERCVMLVYGKPCRIQKFAIFRILLI